MERKPKEIKAIIKSYWDAAADEWENKIGDRGDLFRQHKITPLIFDLLPECEGKTVLDVGCGNGYLIPMLNNKGFAAYGLDISPRQLFHAQKRVAKDCLYETDIEKIETLPSKKCDIVICSMVLDGLQNLYAAFRGCYRLLKQRGYLIITLPHPAHYLEFGKFKKRVSRHKYPEELQLEAVMTKMKKTVIFFHRPIRSYVNALIDNGFFIRKMVEPATPIEIKKFRKQTGRKAMPSYFLGILAIKGVAKTKR